MATVAPTHRAGSPPERFVEALNGLVVGIVSLEFVRRTLAAALEADERAAPAVQSLMDDAYHEGRLASRDYEALSLDLGSHVGEDEPTEWSEQTREGAVSAAGSDTPGADAAPTGMPSLYPGAILRDRFVLQARLGSSGMSDVFKALDRRRQEAGADNPWVAIKVIGPATPRFPEALKLLQHEAALAQRLDHPHIARVYDFDRDGDYAFITMEWLDGESLGDVLTRQRSLSVANARQILDEIGEALAFAHARGITHADIKPGNIFLTRDGPARLIDFGIARSSTAATGTAARTPAYASCEVLEGYAAEPCDDVYSLACVCYRMLAGRRPFGHNDALAAEGTGRRPAPIRTLGPSQWTALERALELRRANRTPDIETFLAEFDSSPMRAPAGARTAARRPVAPASRRVTPALAAGIAILFAVVIAAVAWLNTGTTPDDGAATIAAAPRVATPAPVTVPAPVPPAMTMTAATDESANARRGTPTESGAALADTTKPSREKTVRKENAKPVAKRSAAKPAKAAVGAMAAARPAIAPESPPVGGLAQTPTADAAGGLAETTPDATLVPLKQFKFKRYVEPAVPHTRQRAPTGWVEVEFLVDTKGVTRNIAVVSSSPAGRYEAVALAAVKRWRFVPAKEDGKPVERRTSVRLRFEPE